MNLGQGFPDDPGPLDVRQKAADAVVNGWNQYPPMMGLADLRSAAAAHYKHWQGLDLDPEPGSHGDSGATEALAGALMALIEPGDEVVLFQPLYDAYLPLVQRVGRHSPSGAAGAASLVDHGGEAGSRLLRAHQAGAVQQSAEPHRGGAFRRARCNWWRTSACASTPSPSAMRCGSIVMFDGRPPSAHDGAPGMRARTVKISSAGKIFGMTGWKVGLVFALTDLMRVLGKAHQFLTFTTPPNLQVAVAYGLGKDEPISRTCGGSPALAGPAGQGLGRAWLSGFAQRRHLLPFGGSGRHRSEAG